MRHRRLLLAATIAAGSFLGGCQTPLEDAGSCPDDAICVTGTVRYQNLEGGFWAVRGDDATLYDPFGGLPADYRVEGLRVRLTAREQHAVGIHMAGKIVEILAIRRL